MIMIKLLMIILSIIKMILPCKGHPRNEFKIEIIPDLNTVEYNKLMLINPSKISFCKYWISSERHESTT